MCQQVYKLKLFKHGCRPLTDATVKYQYGLKMYHIPYFRIILLFQVLVLQTNWTSSSAEPTRNNSALVKLTSEQIAKLEMEQFQLEMDDFIREQEEEHLEQLRHARVKRTVLYNSEAPLDIVLVFSIPITVLLPVLQNVFTNLNWSKIFKWKRSVDDDKESENEYVEESSVVQPQLDKITGYFELMMVPEKSCQQRAICEFSADPSKYYPVSELVLDKIRSPSLPALAYLDRNQSATFIEAGSHPRRSLFQAYTNAADKGLAFGQNICLKDFSSKCPYSIQERLNMPALQFWSLLSSLLNFNIRDNVSNF